MALIHLNEENFKAEVIDSKIPVIIDFWAEWCGPCRMMGPVFEELSNDKELAGKIKFAKVDTEDQPGLAGSFQIRGIPSLSIVKGTVEVDRIVGFGPKEMIKERITNALKAN